MVILAVLLINGRPSRYREDSTGKVSLFVDQKFHGVYKCTLKRVEVSEREQLQVLDVKSSTTFGKYYYKRKLYRYSLL